MSVACAQVRKDIPSTYNAMWELMQELFIGVSARVYSRTRTYVHTCVKAAAIVILRRVCACGRYIRT